jgi:hypothetical protein
VGHLFFVGQPTSIVNFIHGPLICGQTQSYAQPPKIHRFDLLHYPPVRLSLSARLISRGTVFFSHSKIAIAGL